MTLPAFLVDECLPAEVTLAEVWALAAAENRVLVTRDLDFPLRDVLPRPAGLVLLRAPENSTAHQLGALVAALVDTILPAGLVGNITVVSPGRYRQRAW